MSVERENAVINNQIILRNNFRFASTGDFFDPSAISKVEILDSDGVTVIETVTGAGIIKDATGKYHVVAAAITSAKTIYDKWYFTPASGAAEITKTNSCVIWESVAGAGGLTTLANLREYLKKEATDTTDDTLLTKIISRVSEKIEKKCNRTFLAANHTEYFAGNGINKQYIKNWPINSVTSIHVDDDRAWGSDSAVAAEDIIISSQNPGMIILADGEIFTKTVDGIENVRIIYNGGYSTIPTDLEQACIELCCIEYIKSGGIINTTIKDKIDPESIEEKAWELINNNYRAVAF